MSEERLITVAIHTYEKAILLKTLLESEGITVALQNVNLLQPVVSSGVRVRIKESDLPLALRIIENSEIFLPPKRLRDAPKIDPILVPTDFSAYSVHAARLAFQLAASLKTSLVFLHSYIDPFRTGNLQLTDALSYDAIEGEDQILMEKEVEQLMDEFTARFRTAIKTGELPAVKFVTEVVEGIPEESILEYAKVNHPAMIVMGTRGAGKKEKELVGSVTAEVLDSCRVPAFTIPEDTKIHSLDDIRDVVFFSNLEQEDILAMDSFYRLFPSRAFNITLVHIPSKKERATTSEKGVKKLLEYCQAHYPAYSFTIKEVQLPTIVDDFRRIAQEQPIDLIVTPNKKKNIFARLFNPSLAHKLLFHADIPMMVVPV